MPKIRQTGTFALPNFENDCDIIAAGKDPVFGKVTPDQWTAYSTIKFARSLPMVAGPESISGAVFGIHPAVIARSYQGIRHKQMNMGHKLVSLGEKEDRICGCVLQCAFPAEPEGGWVIPDTVDEAPSITAFAALFKQAKGVPKMLGDHLGGKVKMSVSMELTYFHDEVGIYDPVNRMTYDRADIPKNLSSLYFEDDHGRIIVRRNSRNPALVLALGGLTGQVWFSGVGYTDRPAESTASIDSIAATRREGELIVCGCAEEAPAFAPGMEVKWVGGEFNRGRVVAAHMEGTHKLAGKTLVATSEDPALVISLPNGVRILRRSSSVVKKS